MAKVIMTIAPDDGMCFEDIMSFRTDHHIGIWDCSKEKFMLVRESSYYFEPWYLDGCYKNLSELDEAVYIALFAALFLNGLQTETIKKYYRVCDACGRHSEYADSYNDALAKAKANGWLHVVDGNKDYCPSCQMEL